jgi:hypothetical protein
MQNETKSLTANFGHPLGCSVQEEIESKLAALRAPLGERCLSDYTFRNLFLFSDAHGYRYLPGEHACIAGRTYDGTAHLLPLFDLRSASQGLLSQLLEGRECFFPLPAEAVADLDPSQFKWQAVRDDADYLYPAAQFLSYEASGLGGKRSFIRRLLARHAIYARPISAGTLDDALAVLAGWSQDKGKSPDEADAVPCRQAIEGSAGLAPLPGFIYYAAGFPAGLLLAEELNPQVCVIRFAKGREEFDGIFPYMFHDFCLRGGPALRWLNFEQDLGLVNFRRTKLSYRPAALLPKYRVTLRATPDSRQTAG